MKFGQLDLEEPISCPGTTCLLSKLDVSLACQLSSVLSYYESIQALSHLAQTYPKTKLDTYLHYLFKQIYNIEPTYTMEDAISLEKRMNKFEKSFRIAQTGTETAKEGGVEIA